MITESAHSQTRVFLYKSLFIRVCTLFVGAAHLPDGLEGVQTSRLFSPTGPHGQRTQKPPVGARRRLRLPNSRVENPIDVSRSLGAAVVDGQQGCFRPGFWQRGKSFHASPSFQPLVIPTSGEGGWVSSSKPRNDIGGWETLLLHGDPDLTPCRKLDLRLNSDKEYAAELWIGRCGGRHAAYLLAEHHHHRNRNSGCEARQASPQTVSFKVQACSTCRTDRRPGESGRE